MDDITKKDGVQLTTTPSLKPLIEEIEKELLDEIIKNLKENKLTVEKAQELAKEFFSLLPIEDKKDLRNKLYTLSKDNQEALGVYVHYANTYDAEERERKLTQMSQHIKNGEIEDALMVAKGGTK
jgi:hypothetical protein